MIYLKEGRRVIGRELCPHQHLYRHTARLCACAIARAREVGGL